MDRPQKRFCRPKRIHDAMHTGPHIMEELRQQIERVQDWHTELLPVSQEDTVRTLARRLEPVLKAIYSALQEVQQAQST